VIPVIGLRRWFGLEQRPHDKYTRIIVVEARGTVLGFIVDSVSEVLRIPSNTVEPPPRIGKVERDYIAGVGRLDDRLLLLLNLDRLMTSSEILQCEAAQA
jgi:purine-binding chemotaxis protein CheW